MLKTTDMMPAGDVLTERVRATWMDGDFGVIAPSFEGGAASFHTSLTDLWTAHNQATDGTTYVESEYLEVVGIKN